MLTERVIDTIPLGSIDMWLIRTVVLRVCLSEIYRRHQFLLMNSPLISHFARADHSVHAPQMTTDPWVIEFPESPGYHIKAVDGVFNLYRDAEHTNNLNYPYLKLDDFVQDMQSICAMMADGPLWVWVFGCFFWSILLGFP